MPDYRRLAVQIGRDRTQRAAEDRGEENSCCTWQMVEVVEYEVADELVWTRDSFGWVWVG